MIRIAALLVCFVTACGAAEPRVRLTEEWPGRIDDYDDVVEKWTRKGTLRGGYQEVLELAATLKSPEWRAAYAARDADNRGLQGEARAQLLAQAQAAAAGPYELQVMVTTWDRRENDLDRGVKSVWKIVLLDEQGMEVPPLEIVKDKRPAFVVRAEYPDLGDFAQSYVARFPREAKILGPGVKKVRLRISSSRGGLELAWNDAP
jgi:hypothetical protein